LHAGPILAYEIHHKNYQIEYNINNIKKRRPNMSYINISDYGVEPNTGAFYTKEIQTAFNEASANNATVLIPAGEFLTGTLNLGSASLYLEKGAILKGSPNIADYVFNGYEHNEMGKTLSLLYSLNNDDIRIYGEGTINLNGDSFYHMEEPSIPKTIEPLTKNQLDECPRTYDNRPNQPIFFYNCNRVHIEGVRIINAPCWTMAFIECEDIHVTGLTIDNNLSIPNNDGMHFCSCKKVFVRDCNISSGDDCIAISCITDWNKPCEDIVISDCILRSSSKAIVVGYMHSIVRNVCITNCIIKESNRGLCVMTSSRTGLVENLLVSNLLIDTRIRAGGWWGNGEAICIMSTYHHNSSYADKVPDRLFPVNIRNVNLQNIICSTENVLAIVGEGDNIRDVHFNGLTVELKDSENIMIKGRIVDVSPSEQVAALPEEQEAYWLHLQGTRDITIDNAFISPFHNRKPRVSERNCRNIYINAVNLES